MKITYDKNPLNSKVELDENEKKELWYKIKLSELEELIFSAHFHLQEGKYYDLEKAKKEVNPDYYMADNDDEKSKLDLRCDMLLEHYLEELQLSHVGDCTCVPCSCSKCHAESFIGIDTMKGLGKHSAYKIDAAFGKNNEKTIDEAINSLSKFEINPQDYQTEGWKKIGGYEQYIPRWEAETKVAHDWLVNYKNTHFKDVL